MQILVKNLTVGAVYEDYNYGSIKLIDKTFNENNIVLLIWLIFKTNKNHIEHKDKNKVCSFISEKLPTNNKEFDFLNYI